MPTELKLLFITTVKTFIICGIKISQFGKNNLFAQTNFGVQNIPWFQMIKQNLC